MPTHWQIPGSDGQPILGNTHQPSGEPVGVLLIAHGFKGYKDYGLLPRLAQHAAKQGLTAHRFNFSHSGMTNKIDTFERPDLFERDTWSRQVHDLIAVTEAVERGDLAGRGLPIVLFGHSRGGTSTLLAGAELGDRIAGVITAAAPSYACGLDEQSKTRLRNDGRLASPSGRTGQTLYVGKAWLDEIERDPQAVDPVRAMRKLTAPALVVHGTGDDTVSPDSARKLAEAGQRTRLLTIDGASHTFDCPNPLPPDQSPPAATAELIEEACAFALRC